VRRWLESGGGPCDVMIDTGMSRLGLSPDELGDESLSRLDVELLMSHLASADEDSPLNARQLALFRDAIQRLGARRHSLANSAGIALGPDYSFDVTRPGLALYGGVPRGEFDGLIRQVGFPQAAVIMLRRIRAGDTVGYNATFTAQRDIPAAVVSLGYADGFLRCRGTDAALQFGEKRLPLLGKISMDMVVVDCSEAPDLREGDWVDIPQHLPDAAAKSGLTQYEILTVTGQRFR
ncbi:MAG: alanine racemase, partial [Betaproteobacteria bacterium]|nr:alanine racemase [Betaproteobacteria bacterium]